MNGKKFRIFLLIGAILMAWLTGWGFRKEITIQDTNVGGNLTDFPVYVPIKADADFHEARADGYDIRFTLSDGETLLKYSRPYWSGGNGSAATATFFAKVPSILASGGAIIYCYYGKSDAPDGQDAANTWDSGYKAVYHLNEANGTIYDDTGNNHDSVAENVMAYQQAGKMRYAIQFEPSDGGAPHYIQIADHADFDVGTGALTVELWCKADEFSFWDTPLSKRVANGWRFYEHNTDDLLLYMINGGDNTNESADLDAGNWHFWAMTRDVSKNHHGYKDGAEIGTLTAFDFDLDSTDPLWIGNLSTISGNGFDGLIEEVRFSDVERDSDWLLFQFKNIDEGDNELGWASEEAAGGAYTLVCDAGSLVITGTAMTPLHASKLSCAAGSMAITGTTLTLLHDKKFTLDAGSFVITGTAVSPLYGAKISAATGTYAITGTVLTPLHDKKISLTAGSYAITGADVTLTYSGGVVVVMGGEIHMFMDLGMN